MRASVLIVGILGVVAGAAAVVWTFHKAPPSQQELVEKYQKDQRGDVIPARSGPHPVAAVDEPEYHFGRMQFGTSLSRDFVFRNTGEALLRIKQGHSTCQCTISNLGANGVAEIAPGASGTVTLSWKPTAEAPEFSQTVDILTNDPQKDKVELRVQGMVMPLFDLLPAKEWDVLEVFESSQPTIEGKVGSPILEEFKITSVEPGNPMVKAELAPLTDAELGQTRMLSGYRVSVRLEPDPSLPIGVFRIPLKFKTDVPQKDGSGFEEVEAILTGNRRGPLQFMGREWFDERSAIMLGSFQAETGKSIKLKLVCRQDPDGGLKFSEVVSDPPQLAVNLQRDDQHKGRGGLYYLTVDYPAGSPRTSRMNENAARIKIRTNHPQAPVVELPVYLVAH